MNYGTPNNDKLTTDVAIELQSLENQLTHLNNL